MRASDIKSSTDVNEAFVSYVSVLLLDIKDPSVMSDIEVDVLSMSGSSDDFTPKSPYSSSNLVPPILPRKTEVNLF